MIAMLLLVLAACAEPLQSTGPPGDAAAIATLRAAWHEALELDVPSEVLAGGTWIESASDADPELVALFARALASAGLAERADALLGQKSGPQIALARARLALDRDELERAIRELAPPAGSTEPVRFPAVPEAFLLLGRAHARAGDLARAEPLLVEFVSRAPWHVEAPQAWFVLVDAALARGDSKGSTSRERSRAQSAEWHAFYRARRVQIRANPSEALPRLGLAQLWLSANELERARDAVESALALDASFCRGQELAAEIERRAGRVEDARARADAALACDSKLVEVHLTLARLARDAGDTTTSNVHLARYRELGGKKEL